MIKNFQGKTAVITGGASGIGLALAERAADENMRIVIADIEEPVLAEAEKNLRERGAEVLALRCDVSRAEEVENLLQQSLSQFGAVHLLCNNAGVSAGGPCWETPLSDWEWVLGVNLWGVIYGVRLFLPAMMQQEEAHIVNTASIAGMLCVPEIAPYNVSKHGVVALSETLCSELRNAESPLGVSVLCPSFVRTRIHLAERNRDPQQADGRSEQEMEEALRQADQAYEGFFRDAMPPESVAELVFSAARENRFYVFTHIGSEEKVERRMRGIIEGRNPDVKSAEEFPLEYRS